MRVKAQVFCRVNRGVVALEVGHRDVRRLGSVSTSASPKASALVLGRAIWALSWLGYEVCGAGYVTEPIPHNQSLNQAGGLPTGSQSPGIVSTLLWQRTDPWHTAEVEPHSGAPGDPTMRPSGVLLGLISAFVLNSAALAQDNSVAAWGSNQDGEASLPPSLGACRQVAGGNRWSLALKMDGTVVAWGSNSYGALNVPSNLGPCIWIAAGQFHSYAIKQSGTVVYWGNGLDGGGVPPNLGPCRQVATANYHTYALRTDGTVTGWGENSVGELSIPDSLGACSWIASGDRHGLAVKLDGQVRCWGWNYYGQATSSPLSSPCTKVAAGQGHSLALGADGTVYGWGAGLSSTGTNWNYGQLIIPADLGPCTDIAAGNFHSVALRADGVVRAWGAGGANTPSDGINFGQSIVPPNLGPCDSIAAGWNHTLAIRSARPTIAGVLPISGPATGGTRVVISGTNFRATSTVTFGGAPATDITFISSTQISAITPPGFPGPAEVGVDQGSSTAFYYRPECGSDLDQDGEVTAADISIVLLDFGPCYSQSATPTAPTPTPLADEPAQKTGTAKKE